MLGARVNPPTDDEVTDATIVAWLFKPFSHVDHRGAHDWFGLGDQPRVLQVFLSEDRLRRVFAPGREKALYLSADFTLAPDWVVGDGYWSPVHADAAEFGRRTGPPTDEEVADATIVAWLFKPFDDRVDHQSAHDRLGRGGKPRLLQVLVVGGAPRAFEPGRERALDLPDWKMDPGYWQPLRAVADVGLQPASDPPRRPADEGAVKVYWLDSETTGLDPAADHVLEVALEEAGDLAGCLEVRRRTALTVHWDGDVEQLSPFVRSTHEASGLLAQCRATARDAATADRDLCDFVDADGCSTTRLLAGSSVHFDRGFLLRRMPALASRFSHRLLDVTAVELACVALGMPPIDRSRVAHRAAADIRESRARLATCFAWMSR